MTSEPVTRNDSSDLTKRTTQGAAWLILVRLASKGIDFLSLLILAKLLSPTDFGIIAIAMTLVLLIDAIFELPVSQVLVSMPLVTSGHVNTAFTLSALRGLGLMGVLWIISIPFSLFYRDTRMIPLICLLSFAPALKGMISPRLSFFIKRLDFRRDMLLDFGNKLVTLTSSALAAWFFRDYRALMVGIIVSPLVLVILSYVFAPYQPRLSLKNWSDFSRFVGWTTVSQFLSALNWQCDRLLLGRFVTPAELGNYSLANDLSFIPEQALIKPIVRPLLSAFSLIGDDLDRLRSAYRKASSSILAVGMPLMLGLSFLADPAVRFILGNKWTAAIPTLHWLALTLIPPLLVSPFPSLAMAKGHFSLILRQTVSESASKIPLMLIGALMFGIPGAIGARAISSIITSMFVVYYTSRILKVSFLTQIIGLWRIFASGLVLTMYLLLARPLLYHETGIKLGVHLSLISIGGLVFYAIALLSFWFIADRPSGIEELAWDRALLFVRKAVR